MDEDPLVRAVVQAWRNPGPRPDLHRAAQEKLKAEWPALAQAVERLARRHHGRARWS